MEIQRNVNNSFLYFKENPPVVQGFQLVMEGKDGIDFGSGRCFILQLQNKSLAFNNAYVSNTYL